MAVPSARPAVRRGAGGWASGDCRTFGGSGGAAVLVGSTGHDEMAMRGAVFGVVARRWRRAAARTQADL